MILVCTCAASQLMSVARQNADGTNMIKLGNSFNNSMLKLIGHSFENLEDNVLHRLCNNNPCTLWSNWTICTATRYNDFGFKARMRKCWYNSTSECVHDGKVTTEKVSKMCERVCRPDYNITKHGFCLKASDQAVVQADAEKICKSEGGHVINVDTPERWTDYVEITKTGMSRAVWIDGTRTKSPGPFSFRSGTDPSKNGVVHWMNGQPENRDFELCIATSINGPNRYWWDDRCTQTYSYVCEIR